MMMMMTDYNEDYIICEKISQINFYFNIVVLFHDFFVWCVFKNILKKLFKKRGTIFSMTPRTRVAFNQRSYLNTEMLHNLGI